MSKTIIEQATPRLANSENGVLTDEDGDEPRDFYWQDTWLYAQAPMGVACRAYGWRPIDGLPEVIKNPTDLAARSDCLYGASLCGAVLGLITWACITS